MAYDPPITEKGKLQAFEAGKRIAEAIKSEGYAEAPVKFISSPFLRTLQTCAYLQEGVTNSTETSILVNEYLSQSIKLRMQDKNGLRDGMYATNERSHLIANYLGGKIASADYDTISKLPLLNIPAKKEKDFDKRYVLGIQDIIRTHFMNTTLDKLVLVLVSHHKALRPLIKSKFKGLQDSKLMRKEFYVEHPSYCCTVQFKFEEGREPVESEQQPVKAKQGKKKGAIEESQEEFWMKEIKVIYQ
ncbi:hypothetical protein FGO68_gene15149 [Halteria grandinella]|uniref:Uncharacterized protein n=1 Tax=Halteria grandinella TaxID=5974 RepID=A0A8J8NLG1_HALGN|nr:hypothetical protein FGO68_gene15149 [Halteria grandinella]